MKHYLSALFFCSLLLCSPILCQNRAPSCWYWYQDNFSGDIIINSVRVISPTPVGTYYCVLQWNAGSEGGGYCGIQEHPNGRNFIFSLWDSPSTNEPIIAPYKHAGTNTEPFGGEGTGLKSWNFTIGWETGHWYSLVSRAWNSDGHSLFGFWVFDHSNTNWHHIVTMEYPVEDVKFSSSTGSFLEDWIGNGNLVREVNFQSGWKRNANNQAWTPFSQAYFYRVYPD